MGFHSGAPASGQRQILASRTPKSSTLQAGRKRLEGVLLRPSRPVGAFRKSSSFLLLLNLHKFYEPSIRARLGTDAYFVSRSKRITSSRTCLHATREKRTGGEHGVVGCVVEEGESAFTTFKTSTTFKRDFKTFKHKQWSLAKR